MPLWRELFNATSIELAGARSVVLIALPLGCLDESLARSPGCAYGEAQQSWRKLNFCGLIGFMPTHMVT